MEWGGAARWDDSCATPRQLSGSGAGGHSGSPHVYGVYLSWAQKKHKPKKEAATTAPVYEPHAQAPPLLPPVSLSWSWTSLAPSAPSL
jgi:hypothetical protein